MVIAKNLKSVYEKNKAEILKMVALDQNKPLGFEEMEYSFVDLQGRKYFSFPESTALPLERLAKLEQTKVYLSSGLHNGTINEICGYMNEVLGNIVNSGFDTEVKKNSSKNIANLGMLINEIKTRQETYMPIELFYDFLACQLVREDEKPYVFNNEIHLDKINALMDLNKANGGFFFGCKELKLLQNLLNMSEIEWVEYWQQSEISHRLRSQALRTYLSESKS